MPKASDSKFILWFNEIGIGDVSLVGGKNASLGEMYQNLESKGIKVPNGFLGLRWDR
jgi:pyruvate,water dikinase